MTPAPYPMTYERLMAHANDAARHAAALEKSGNLCLAAVRKADARNLRALASKQLRESVA